MIHFKDYLQGKASKSPVQSSTDPKGGDDGNIIPFRVSNPSPDISRVQIATLVDKLMEMPDDEVHPQDFNLHDKSVDPFECIAEKILSEL